MEWRLRSAQPIWTFFPLLITLNSKSQETKLSQKAAEGKPAIGGKEPTALYLDKAGDLGR